MKKSLVLLSLLTALSMQHAAAEESLPQRVGAGMKKGGEAAAKGIKKGGDATVKGVKKAGDWVGQKLRQGGEKLEKASK